MSKKDIIDFFNQCAPSWDNSNIRKENVLNQILDNAGIHPNINILDIACGTGVMFQDYLNRDVLSITAIDISPEMIKIAKSKFDSNPKITIVCGDAENYSFEKQFDVAMIFNAFPHFMEPKQIISATAHNLRSGGKLSIAHDMSRAALDKHHGQKASNVSIRLLPETELAKLMEPYFEIDHMISTDYMYQVTGIKK